MSRFSFVRKGRPASSALAAVYDTRFGTATDSSGWITFDLHSGNRRVWVDSSGGNDSNDGLSAAAAKATLDAALAVFWGAEGTSGDQLMIAGTGGRTYIDGLTGRWTGINGISAAYPTVAMSYDPADEANSAKYGKLVGVDMPVITRSSSGSSFDLNSENGGLANNFFIQGIEFKADANDGAGYAINWSFRHDNVGVQNCRFNKFGLGIDNAGSASGLNQVVNVSKCSFWGQWSTSGACVALYVGGLDGLYCQDNSFAHCGWKIGATRAATSTSGGASVFSHAHYYHATGINGRFDRNFYTDSAHDGLNVRGGAIITCPVALDEPVAATFGGFSNGALWATEAPDGVLITVDDPMFMGGSVMTTTPGDEYGWGPRNSNTIAGSYMRNAVMFDNPQISTAANALFNPENSNADAGPTIFLVDQFRAYNYAAYLDAGGGFDPSKVHTTFTNGLVDSLTLSASTASTDTTVAASVVVHSGLTTFPDAMTRDEVITALLTAVGVTPGADYTARKAQLVNLACWRPDLPWAQLLIDIGFPAYNLTPTYQAATIPNLSAESPRAVY